MSTHSSIAKRICHVALLFGLTTVPPALAACPPDTFVDEANFSHVDDDPDARADQDRGGHTVGTNGQVVAYGMVGHPSYATHHVYLYQRGASPAQWSFLKRLDQPGYTETTDHFGQALAMDGNTLVVGADGAGVDSSDDGGAVYVYQRDAGGTNTWGTTQSVYYDGINFGESLDIHRNRMVVGAPYTGDGKAVIYERSSASADFTEVAELLPPAADLARTDSFGLHVTLYGDVAVVSDPRFSDASDTSLAEGRVYVYARDQGGAGQWGLVTTLPSPASVPQDVNREFGHAISIWGSDDQTRGETIAVSLPQQQGGHVYLFGRDTGGADHWGQIADLTPADEDGGYFGFGSSLHLHSNELLVGDATGLNIDDEETGAVYVYHKQAGGSSNWGQVQKLSPPSGTDHYSNYGWSVDWSSGVAVIGSPLARYGDDEYNVGRAYILFDDLIFCDPFE